MGNRVVGSRIQQRRKQIGLTLDDIAREIGVAKSTVQRYETGDIERLKLPVIEAIARVLSVSPSWLCGKSEDMFEERPAPAAERNDKNSKFMKLFEALPEDRKDEVLRYIQFLSAASEHNE